MHNPVNNSREGIHNNKFISKQCIDYMAKQQYLRGSWIIGAKLKGTSVYEKHLVDFLSGRSSANVLVPCISGLASSLLWVSTASRVGTPCAASEDYTTEIDAQWLELLYEQQK